MTDQPTHDLLGDPLPEPLPERQILTDLSDLVGHTIKAVFENPLGRRDNDIVIVTETLCYLALHAEPEDSESAHLTVDRGDVYRAGYPTSKAPLEDFVSANELFQADCITSSEFAALKAVEAQREAQAKAERAAHLRRQLAELEGLRVDPPTQMGPDVAGKAPAR